MMMLLSAMPRKLQLLIMALKKLRNIQESLELLMLLPILDRDFLERNQKLITLQFKKLIQNQIILKVSLQNKMIKLIGIKRRDPQQESDSLNIKLIVNCIILMKFIRNHLNTLTTEYKISFKYWIQHQYFIYSIQYLAFLILYD